MSTTEISREFQSAIVLSQYVIGSICACVNIFVCMLIILDKDPRGKEYRTYLFSLQFTSTVGDILMSAYAPIAQMNCRVMYADSALSHYVNLLIASVIYCTVMSEISFSYFTCVYYRRKAVLPPSSRFILRGWKFLAMLLVFQILIALQIYQLYNKLATLQALLEEIPATISWVKTKPTYSVLFEAEFSFASQFFVNLTTLILSTGIIVIVIQLVFVIRRGMKTASPATKKYQTRAIISLFMQGAIPTVLIIAPMVVMSAIYSYSFRVDELEAASNTTASAVSALSFNIMSLHAVAQSLTVLACSPAYRKNIRLLISSITSTFRQAPFLATTAVANGNSSSTSRT